MSSSTRQIMKCEEAAEFVSALCDGESIPPEAAEHIGTCETCQARLKEYGEIGMALRRVASLESLEEVRARLARQGRRPHRVGGRESAHFARSSGCRCGADFARQVRALAASG